MNSLNVMLLLIYGLCTAEEDDDFPMPPIDSEYRPLQYYISELNEKTYYEGRRLHNDKLIHNVTVFASTKYLPTIVREVKYPVHHDKGYSITCIQVIDKATGNGQVFVVKGGVGHRSLYVRLESPQTGGMKYNLLLYSLEPVYYMDGVTLHHTYIKNMIEKESKQKERPPVYVNNKPDST